MLQETVLPKTCRGPSAYNAERLNDAVDTEIRKHLVRLGRIEIGENYEVHIQFKVSAEQFIRQTA